jgi:hypothetical protein
VNAPAQGGGLTARDADSTVFATLIALSVSHLLNDTIQSPLPASYPLLRDSFALNNGHIGLITFTFQVTVSLSWRTIRIINYGCDVRAGFVNRMAPIGALPTCLATPPMSAFSGTAVVTAAVK